MTELQTVRTVEVVAAEINALTASMLGNIVEIGRRMCEAKEKFVRRMQRDYAVRRRVFLEMVARPAGWKFTEIISADSAVEVKRWRELAKEGKTL